MSTKNSFNHTNVDYDHQSARSGMTKRKFTKDFKRYKADKYADANFWKRTRNIRFHKQSREDGYGGDLFFEEPLQENEQSQEFNPVDCLDAEPQYDPETADIWDKMAALCHSQVQREQAKKRLAAICEWHDEPCKKLPKTEDAFVMPMTSETSNIVQLETLATKETVETTVGIVNDKLRSLNGKATFFQDIYLWKCVFYEPGTTQFQTPQNSFEIRMMTDIHEHLELGFYRTSNGRTEYGDQDLDGVQQTPVVVNPQFHRPNETFYARLVKSFEL